MAKINKPTILIAPLDWGLGHATRCIPIIRTLKNNGYDILVAVNQKQKAVLKTEFCDIRFIDLVGYNINYAKNGWLFAFKIASQIPKILWCIKKENKWLNKIIDRENISLVISDNRFGLFTKKVPCIFITHQLTIKASYKWIENILQKINYSYINKFSQCWVPDMLGTNSIAGTLSQPTKKPKIAIHYIGVLSRFSIPDVVEKKYDVCVLLSGPEPQRTVVEKILLQQLSSIKNIAILFVRGLPQATQHLQIDGLQIVNHLQQNELQKAICSSNIIIARSGYTTVMEILTLQKKSILIATPGQTEQEYLATYLHQKNMCLSYKQNDINITTAIQKASVFNYSILNSICFNEDKLLALVKELLVG